MMDWRPINDLPEVWEELRDPQIEALMAAWHEQVAQLEQKQHYVDFLMRMRREWAIETGVLERLYTLSEGATKTLIEQGFDAALIQHEDTNRSVREVIALIQDQYNVIEGLYQLVSGDRPLGTSYLRELHQALTAHQDTFEAVDADGKPVRRSLPKGAWKTEPNEIGDVACCPPEQVPGEVERLLRLHHEHERVPPYIEAAWIHHRFTLIHPFPDGNGRISRCLATLVFLKHRWFPLVLTRAERTEYIRELRAADSCNLKPLVDLFCRLQRLAVRRAMSLAEDIDVEQRHRAGVLKALREKFRRVGAADTEKRQQALTVGDTLHKMICEVLEELAPEVEDAVRLGSPDFAVEVRDAARGDARAHYNHSQIIECVSKLSYWANFRAYQSWAAMHIDTDSRTEILFSLHGMGQGDTGAYACAAMMYTRETNDEGETTLGATEPLADEPFSFTYSERPNDVVKRFRPWVTDRALDALQRLDQRS